MTIRRGQAWGEIVDRLADPVVAGDDAAVAAHLGRGDERPLLVTGGDLLRTLGGSSRDGRLRRYTIDLLRVALDGDEVPAVAHVVVRRPGWSGWWRGPLWAACNVSELGAWDVAPRAHPNDGRVDVIHVAATMSWRARVQARRRLPTGSHLPHPEISVVRTARVTWQPAPGTVVVVDGVELRPATEVTVIVAPDAGVVHA